MKPSVNINLSDFDINRFWSKVDKKSNDECWLWLDGISNHGYGKFAMRGAYPPAHRVSWTIHFGKIPNNLFVCHKCDIKYCVNPYHLFLGTHKDNMRGMTDKNRQAKGTQQGISKLSDDDARQIRKLRSSGAKLTKLAEMFGVVHGTISFVCAGDTWKHVK